MNKNTARLRRARKTRSLISRQEKNRLTVHRTPRHIYAQITSADGSKVFVAVSTIQKAIKDTVKSTSNLEAASQVGKSIAEKAAAAGITDVAFDRSGFKYHGRVAALADAARENGLKF
ncbi:MAG TPA: 50S ribosomal protein L18 [Crenotrichaceae bacterium]|nr:50S ribosomal protein L18 [Crenotrichaceae bacterium]